MPRNVTISDNVFLVPLNPMGAVELGLWPCAYCDAGWGISSTTKSESCHSTCLYLKDAAEKKSQEILKNIALKNEEALKIPRPVLSRLIKESRTRIKVKRKGKHGRYI